MSACQEYCLSCPSSQEFKVNFIQVHGLCTTHLSHSSEILKCIHCECLIPITIISALNQPDSSHSKQSLYTESTQKSIPQACDYCFNKSTLSESTCHNICQDCFKDKCPLCNIEEPVLVPCENCGNTSNASKLQCGHQICLNCCSNGCELCRLLSTNSLNKTVYECEYCLKEVSSIKVCELSHRVCQVCYLEYCPLCSRFSIRPRFCEVCKDEQIKTSCEKGHSLCMECAKKCILCSSDMFSVLDPDKKDSFVTSIKVGNQKDKEKISALEGHSSTENKEGLKEEGGKENEDEKDRGNGLVHYNKNNLEEHQRETKKGNKNGTTSCSQCILF